MSKLFSDLLATTKAIRECYESGGHEMEFLRDSTDFRITQCTKCKMRVNTPHG